MQGNGFQDLLLLCMIAGLGSYDMEYKESIEGASKSFGNFFSSIVRLRTPGGCPWDSRNTGAAWLSSARVVRCWVKSRNERNPCH